MNSNSLICFEPQNIEQGIMNVEIRHSIIFITIKDRALRFHNSSFDIPCSIFDIQIMLFRISNISTKTAKFLKR